MSNETKKNNAEKTPLKDRPWIQKSWKVVKESSKYVAGVAVGVGGTLAYIKFAGE